MLLLYFLMQKATKAKISLGHCVIIFFFHTFCPNPKTHHAAQDQRSRPCVTIHFSMYFCICRFILVCNNGVNFKVGHEVNYAANILKY